ncbi:MAG: PTS glucose transporter subunit IIA [Succinivibrio sp.]
MKKIIKGILKFLGEIPLRKIVSPFEGNVVPSEFLYDVNLASNVIGPSIGVLPTKGEIRAPCNCTVVRVSRIKNALSLKLGNNQLIINVGIDRDKYDRDMFHLLVKEGQIISKGDLLMTFDLPRICLADRNFVCTLTIKQSKYLRPITFINARRVEFDTILTTVALI